MRAWSGMRVMPTLLKMAASKLYSRIEGMPSKYTRRKRAAVGRVSAGTESAANSGSA